MIQCAIGRTVHEFNKVKMTDYKEAVDHLIAAACFISPNEDTHQAFHQFYSVLRKSGISDNQIARHLVLAMLDGLRFGNWLNTVHFENQMSESFEQLNGGIASIAQLG